MAKVNTLTIGKTAIDPTTIVVNPLTTEGSLIVGGANGVPTELPKGAALQVLRMNAAGTAQEYADPTGGGSDITYNDVYFVHKNGSDVDDGNPNKGRSVSTAFLTIGAALAKSGESDLVRILDSGTYEENLIIGGKQHIDGTYAQLKGTITIGSCSTVSFNRIIAPGNNTTLIKNTGCSGRSYVVVKCIRGMGLDNDGFTGTKVLQNLSNESTFIFKASNVETSENGHFIFSVDSGGELELTAGSNNWTGTGVIFSAVSAIWVNSVYTANGQWGNTVDVTQFVDDPTGQNANAQTALYSFASPEVINLIRISQHSSWMFGRSPSSWKVYGAQSNSTNPADWTELAAFGAHTWVTGANDFVFTNSTGYSHYRLVWLAGGSDATKRITIARVELINNDESVGGSITFDVDKLVLRNGSTGILSASDSCNYQGKISETTQVSGTTEFINIEKGFISVVGASAETTTLWNKTGGELRLNIAKLVGNKIGYPDFNVVNPLTTEGSLIVGGANGVPTELPPGNEGEIVKIVGGVPVYEALVTPDSTPDSFFVIEKQLMFGSL
jgi:hypothetical protein